MTRAEEAKRLVDEGRVSISRSTALFTVAIVQGEDSHYDTILYPDGHYFCECDWGQYHSYTDDLCAHALALRLALERVDALRALHSSRKVGDAEA